eukprot:1150006-Pelagomonas_calceolata.AAC.1
MITNPSSKFLNAYPRLCTEHLQGYAELSQPVRLSTVRWWLPSAHWEPRAGSRDSARDYCRKEDSRSAGPWEHGAFEQGGQGSRSDLAAACATLRSGGIHSVAEQHPTEFVKFNRGLRALQDELQETPADEGLHPYPWQQRLLDMVTGDPDDRTIVWVLDRRGGVGKSRLAKHLVLNYGAILLEGRLQDMCYTYNKEPIAVFDISRAAAEHSDHLYSMAEKLKNGLYLSTKYESRQKVFNPPHVIFFANQHPDYEKWSRDRIKVIDLDKEQRLERERSRSPVNQQGSPIM